MNQSQPSLRIGESEYLPSIGFGSATAAARLVSCGLLIVSCGASLLAFAGHASALTMFASGAIGTVVFAFTRGMRQRMELRRARQGGGLRTSDQLAMLEREDLIGWNVGVLIASALVLWAVPALPAIRWLFTGVAVLLLWNGVWHLMLATISICKRRYADANLSLSANGEQAQALIEISLPPNESSTRFSAVLELLAISGNQMEDGELARIIDAACAETARQDGNTISVRLPALDPQIFALLRQKRMWIFHSLSKDIFYMIRVTLRSELRSYTYYWK
jgi:hypothetical protein